MANEKNQVGDNKKAKTTNATLINVIRQKQTNKPLPMLLTDDYFFFRGIININYINNNISSNKEVKKWRENFKTELKKKLVKLRNLSFMYDEL